MQLPVMPPLRPMLARAVKQIPHPDRYDGGLVFEPKWDGFRCLVFRDGDEVVLGSRNTRDLARYFPEVVDAVRRLLPPRCVLDGEIVVALDGRLEFERLLDRIHPADSRVRLLAEQTPASYVGFDLLAEGEESLLDRSFGERRARLEQVLTGVPAPIHLTRTTRDSGEASQWFDRFEGAGLDGVVAKPLTAGYAPDRRTLLKVKHERTADVVVAGYRLHKTSTPERPLLGSMLLGLYDERGVLQHVGVAAAFSQRRRAELVDQLRPLEVDLASHPWGGGAPQDRRPGGETRWNAGKDLSFVPLEPAWVAEVGYEHMEGTRFRHTAQFRRWRPDRDPASCGYAQLEEPVGYDLDMVLGGG